MSPLCPKCGTVTDSGPTVAYVVETLKGRQRVTVPVEWRARSDKSMTTGEAFALKFEDDNGFEAARFNAVTCFYREDAEVSAIGSTSALPKGMPRAMDGGGEGTGTRP